MNRSEASAPHGGAHPPSFPGGLGKVSAREHHTARATPLIPEGTTPPVLPHSILNGHDTQETQLFEHVLSEHQHYFSVNAKAWTPFLGLISVPNFSSAPPSHALMMNRDIEHLASTAMHEKKENQQSSASRDVAIAFNDFSMPGTDRNAFLASFSICFS